MSQFSSYWIALGVLGALLTTTSPDAMAQSALQAKNISRPALVITDDPIPLHVRNTLYTQPTRVQDISPESLVGDAYYQPTQTMVTRKINDLTGELSLLQGNVKKLSSNLNQLQSENENLAAEYYASLATVNTQLQSGTTPGNPRLVQRLGTAESNLDRFGENVGALNSLALSTADAASKSSFLMEQARNAFNISGAVEEDHKQLAILEDSVANTALVIERVLNGVNDDILRTTAYLNSERHNLRTLSLAVSNGDLYGRSLANIDYSAYQTGPSVGSGVVSAQPASYTPEVNAPVAPQALAEPTKLAKIRFDRPNVDFEEPVYAAVNQALQRYPNANFDVVAVHPSEGNAARVAIETTKARRNGQKVLRTLSQMGLDMARVNLTYRPSPEAVTSEVHLFIR